MFRSSYGFAIACLFLAGCQVAGLASKLENQAPGPVNPYDGLGCGAQLAAFRLQALLPSATLSVHVQDASGSPVTGAPLSLSWSGDPAWVTSGPIAGCVGTTDLTTDAAGRVVVGRLKIGTCFVALHQSQGYGAVLASSSVSLRDGQTAELTMIKP